MRKSLLRIGALAAMAGALLAPSIAKADDDHPITLKGEAGVAGAVGDPQNDRFGVGGHVAVKPLIEILPWLVAGPSLSVTSFGSDRNGVDGPTAWAAGATAEARRPHGPSNTGTGFSAVSPWLGVEGQYVRTGPLDRFAWSAAVGAAVPTSDSRQFWVGPFVKYIDVVDSLNDRPGFDNSDAHILVGGLSLEWGPGVKKKAEPAPPPKAEQKAPPKAEEPKKEPPPAAEPVVLQIREKVQFPWDSAKPLPASQEALKSVVLKALLDHPGYKVEVQGHASSEGQVAHNDKLSQKRAQAVADFLIKNGVPAENLTVKGFGSRVPVADNATEAGRVANRRVEFSLDLVLTKQGDKK